MPYLRGIIACLDADALLYRTEPAFPWSSALTQTSSALLPLPTVHAEHLFLLLTYLLALSNYAHHILGSLPEPSSTSFSSASAHLSAEDEKRLAAGLTRAVDLLCQAAGVAAWAAETVCPHVEAERKSTQGRLGRGKWPVETSAESLRGLGMCLLADAHNVAVRKLLLPVLTHSLFSPPGPPLPSNHPSPSLLAKLYLHIASLYTSALAHLRIRQDTSAAPSSSRKLFSRSSGSASSPIEPDTIDGEVIPSLKRYLRKESQLAQALAHKWLGVDVGESGMGQTVGEALSWTQDALARLEEMEDGKMRETMKGLGLGKGNERKKEARKARKGRVERELEDVKGWVGNYKQLNGTVSLVKASTSQSVVAEQRRWLSSLFLPSRRLSHQAVDPFSRPSHLSLQRRNLPPLSGQTRRMRMTDRNLGTAVTQRQSRMRGRGATIDVSV